MIKIYQSQEKFKRCFKTGIKAVYIGRNCEEKNKKFIVDWARRENKVIYQMEIDYKEQKLFPNRLI